MATPSRHEGDLHVNGHLTMRTGALPAGTVTDAMVNASAGIGVEKQEHQYEKSYADESGTTVTAKEFVLHIVHGTSGEVLAFKGGNVVAPQTTEVWEIDLHKNGTTILDTNIVLNSSATSYEIISGIVGTTALVTGDVLEAIISETTGTGTAPAGVFVEVILKEDAV
jgi:hypothetical protein